MKKTKLFFAILLGSLFIAFFVASFEDVSGLRTYSKVYQLTQQQTKMQAIAWDRIFDQRAWVKAKLESPNGCPEILLLGSSTVGQFKGSHFAPHPFLNAWLTAPSIEDLEALSHILQVQNCRPKLLIIGTDHWLLDSAQVGVRWVSLFSDYADYWAARHSLWYLMSSLKPGWLFFKERLTYETMKLSFQKLSTSDWAKHKSDPILLSFSSESELCLRDDLPYLRAYDGHSIRCPSAYSVPEVVNRQAGEYVREDSHGVRGWKPDEENLKRLEHLISNWTRHDNESETRTQVILLSPPLHPTTFAQIIESPTVAPKFDWLDHSLEGLSQNTSVSYLNFRAPDRLGCDTRRFIDGIHSDPDCAQKMASAITQRTLAGYHQ